MIKWSEWKKGGWSKSLCSLLIAALPNEVTAATASKAAVAGKAAMAAVAATAIIATMVARSATVVVSAQTATTPWHPQ